MPHAPRGGAGGTPPPREGRKGEGRATPTFWLYDPRAITASSKDVFLTDARIARKLERAARDAEKAARSARRSRPRLRTFEGETAETACLHLASDLCTGAGVEGAEPLGAAFLEAWRRHYNAQTNIVRSTSTGAR